MTATATRTCEVCGVSIEDRRPQATTCSDACRRAKARGQTRQVAAPPTRPTCPHPATLPDEDGDPVCVSCGALVGTPSRPNGFEVMEHLMITDADGQRRRASRRRPPPPWRDFQPAATPIRIFTERGRS